MPLPCRIAACYGLDEKVLLACRQSRGHRPRHDGGMPRADAQVLLDEAGGNVQQPVTKLPGLGIGRPTVP
ncbi:hypothetical protein [Streptomyces telluris]|uniref:Uncharacterized protein n=1 Tax=Streptomyces telluris TaxID=2720021 RepID=A0A9X2LJZ5_9ACTN|nr:hypothetical protein [Streptomyces telluris]MCQ8773061.1 hypothetical protein [Streptomyces telluris]